MALIRIATKALMGLRFQGTLPLRAPVIEARGREHRHGRRWCADGAKLAEGFDEHGKLLWWLVDYQAVFECRTLISDSQYFLNAFFLI